MSEFEKLVVKEYPKLLGFANRLTRQREDAQDLVQSAIERALRFKSFDVTKGTLGTWLGEIVKNVHTDNLRTKHAIKRVAPVSTDKNHHPPNQEHALYLQQVLERVDKLGTTQQEMLKAAMIGESHSETAVRTKKSLGTIKSAQRVARKKLVAELGRG